MDRSRCLAALLFVTLLNCAALSDRAQAQDSARDYYLAAGDRDATAALRNLDRNHYQPAVRHLRNGQYRPALSDLEFMLKYFPNHPQALATMAQLALASKRPEIAEQRIKEALARYPQHDETHVIYGTFLQRLGRLDAAIAEYKMALEIDAMSGYAHYNLGLAYLDRRDYRQANIHAQEAYRLGVGFPALRTKLEAAGAWNPEAAGGGGDSATSAPSARQQGVGKSK